MKIKIDDEIFEIEYPTFIEWMQTGKITADSLVFSRLVTDGQWIRAGDMRIFRLFSQDTDLRREGTGAESVPVETVDSRFAPPKSRFFASLRSERVLAPEERHFLSFQRALPRLTLILIAVNVFIFILQSIAGGSSDREVLIKFGAYYRPFIFSLGEYWRILTHIFLHIGLPHLLINMGVLFIVGMVLEGLYGKERFFIIYFIAGLMGGIASLFLVREQIGGGASGAIFGLIGTVIVFGIRYKDNIPKRFKRGFGIRLLPFLVIDIVLGFITPNINIPAHIGGLLGGAATALILTPRVFHLPEIQKRETRRIKITTYAIIAVLSFSMGAVALGMFTGVIPRYEKIIERNPKDENTYKILVELYTKNIRKNPENAELYYDKLIHLCKKAIEQFPDDSFDWYAILFALYEEKIKQEPQDEEVAHKLTDVYKIAIKKYPNYAMWYNNLAWLYVQRDVNPKEAIYLAQIALKLNPDDVAILDTLAWAYLKNGQYEHSLNIFEEVFEIHLEMLGTKSDEARRLSFYGKDEKVKAEREPKPALQPEAQALPRFSLLAFQSSWDGVLELASSKIDRKAFLDFYNRMSKKVPEGSEMRSKLESALQILLLNGTRMNTDKHGLKEK